MDNIKIGTKILFLKLTLFKKSFDMNLFTKKLK